MAERRKVAVVSLCSPPPAEGQILLPKGSTVPKRRLLVTKGETEMLMKPGVRADSGNAACVSGAALGALGGGDAEVEYREVSFAGVLRRDRWLALQFAIALLSLVATLLGAYGTRIKSGAGPGFESDTALIAFFLATCLAFLKFANEYRQM